MCAERLRRSSDVRAVFASRVSAGAPLLRVRGRRRSDDGAPRATVVAGKSVGNAVQRNRVKRRLRAALGHTPVPAGFDLIVIGRAAAAEAPFAAVRRDLATAVAAMVRRS
jgi:ribonuclease P protein component